MSGLSSFVGLSLEEARAALAACKGKRDEATIGLLIGALTSEHWQIKKEASDTLVAIGPPVAEKLTVTFKNGTEEQRSWVMKVMARIKGPECIPWMQKLYTSREHTFRASVLEAVNEIPGGEAAQFLLDALEDESWLNRVAAAGYLERRGREILKSLQKGFMEGSGDLKYWCLRLLVQICGQEATGFLRKGLTSDDPSIRHYVIRSMEDVHDDWTHRLLIEALADQNWANRKTAATILQLRGRRAVSDLVNCLKSDNLDVIYWAIKALATIGDERALKPLESLLHQSTNQQVIEWIMTSLATFRTAYTARILVEASYEFPSHGDFIRNKLLDFGVPAVRPLLEYIKSPNRELKTFTRGILLDMGFPAMGGLLKTLDNSPRGEFDSLLEDIGRLPDERLKDLLAGGEVDLGQVHRLAESLESRALPSMSTLNLKLSDKDLQDLKSAAAKRRGEGQEGGAEIEATEGGSDAEIDELLSRALELDASDIHIKSNLPPIFRIQGVLTQTDLPPMVPARVRDFMKRIAGERRLAEFDECKELDLAYEIRDVCRFRVNFYSELDGPGIAFRIIPSRVLSLADLRLPKVFKDICNNRQGLVLVTGPTGAGKSTTLAAMIDYINQTREEHIITIEDPVEFRHINRKSIITYRELGTNTHAFSNALRGALRQDPDVILVGEMRDADTINLAIIASETGHLVLSTLHTMCASETIDRILSQFPPGGHNQITKALADSLRAIISQVLVPTVDGKRCPAMEILIKTYAVANLIREEKLNQIDQAIIAGRELGMQSRDDHLVRLVREHAITAEAALAYCLDKTDVMKKLRTVR